LRFLLAYALLLAVYHKRLFADTWKDELLMLVLGLTGGSLYFLAENTALAYSTATNVSLIVCSCPMVSTLGLAILYKEERLSKTQYFGSVLALMGMAVVVLNGHFVLHLSPRGDLLALLACLCWAAYSILLRGVMNRYPSLFIIPQSILLRRHHHPALRAHHRSALPDHPHAQRSAGPPALLERSRLVPVLHLLEQMPAHLRRSASQQLDILQPHRHHRLRMDYAQRNTHRLPLPRHCDDTRGDVFGG